MSNPQNSTRSLNCTVRGENYMLEKIVIALFILALLITKLY